MITSARLIAMCKGSARREMIQRCLPHTDTHSRPERERESEKGERVIGCLGDLGMRMVANYVARGVACNSFIMERHRGLNSYLIASE